MFLLDSIWELEKNNENAWNAEGVTEIIANFAARSTGFWLWGEEIGIGKKSERKGER